jgi:hypothetical protein
MDDGSEVFFCPASCSPQQDFDLLRRGDLVRFDIVSDPVHRGKTMAGHLAWVIGAEPSLDEIDRRAAREPGGLNRARHRAA